VKNNNQQIVLPTYREASLRHHCDLACYELGRFVGAEHSVLDLYSAVRCGHNYPQVNQMNSKRVLAQRMIFNFFY